MLPSEVCSNYISPVVLQLDFSLGRFLAHCVVRLNLMVNELKYHDGELFLLQRSQVAFAGKLSLCYLTKIEKFNKIFPHFFSFSSKIEIFVSSLRLG